MGLDMYLFRKSENGEKAQVAYWRKANAIHKYFVDRFQDGNDESCSESKPIKVSDLRELRDLCFHVNVGVYKPHEKLPTQGGFFFGSTAYDEWYFADLRSTIEQLDNILCNADEAQEFSYLAWW